MDPRSREETDEVLALARTWQRPVAIMRALETVARDHLYRHNAFRKAAERYQELLAAAERYGSIPGQAEALGQLAGVQAVLGDLTGTLRGAFFVGGLAMVLGFMVLLLVVRPERLVGTAKQAEAAVA